MWCCVLPWLLLAGCQSSPTTKAQPITRLQPHLGTFVSITVYAEPEKARPAINAAFAEFRAVDALLSIHRPDSDLARANAGGPVNAELHAVLEKSLAIAGDTDGAFDPTIRPLADLWGFIKKEGYRLPTADELRTVLTKVDYRKVDLRDGRLLFAAQDMSIDPGGFGKGYAVDRAIAALQRHGIQNAMVKAGGDLRVIGLPPGKDHWIIWLEDPEKKGQRTPVKLRQGAMSTSGQYENFMIIEGKRYGHLLDPRTGRPTQAARVAAVVCESATESDAWATAFLVEPELAVPKGMRVL